MPIPRAMVDFAVGDRAIVAVPEALPEYASWSEGWKQWIRLVNGRTVKLVEQKRNTGQDPFGERITLWGFRVEVEEPDAARLKVEAIHGIRLPTRWVNADWLRKVPITEPVIQRYIDHNFHFVKTDGARV
jgi:hypothetical protein